MHSVHCTFIKHMHYQTCVSQHIYHNLPPRMCIDFCLRSPRRHHCFILNIFLRPNSTAVLANSDGNYINWIEGILNIHHLPATEWGRSRCSSFADFQLNWGHVYHRKNTDWKRFVCLELVNKSDSFCRVFLCEVAYHTWAGRGWRGEAVIQKEWPADGEGHGAGQHVGGYNALHRKPWPRASQLHAAAALPVLSVSHCCSTCDSWRKKQQDEHYSWRPMEQHGFVKLYSIFGQVVPEEAPRQCRILANRKGTVWTSTR